MTQSIDSDTSREVKVLPSLSIPDQAPLPLVEDQRRTVVRREETLRLGGEEVDDVLGGW
jgi:hypothetical protein